MKRSYYLLVLAFFAWLWTQTAQAQSSTPADEKNQFSVLVGLNQPILLQGFNVEANYWMKRFVIDYSHGFSLNLDGDIAGGDLKSQSLDLLVTHSFGLGVGYRITKGLNVRLEPKVHFFEVYYMGEEQTTANRITDYATFTLGVGAYYRWLPFEKKGSWYKGLTVSPSVRYWPNVSSSLDNDQFTYENKITGRTETMEASNIGLNNTPWIFNVSVGYTF